MNNSQWKSFYAGKKAALNNRAITESENNNPHFIIGMEHAIEWASIKTAKKQ